MNESSEGEPKRAALWAASGLFKLEDTLLLVKAAKSLTALLVKVLQPLQLKMETWELLESISGQARTQTELAAEVGGLKSSVSRWVTSLQKQGFVDCRPSKRDRRRQVVCITAYGLQQLQRARNDMFKSLLPLSTQLREVSYRITQFRDAERHFQVNVCERLIQCADEQVNDGLR